jgi:hypothetical protein
MDTLPIHLCARFAAERRSRPGVLLRLVPESPRVWDLSGILPR